MSSSQKLAPLPHELRGNKDAKNLVIFLHGWPDNVDIWSETIENLDTENNYVLLLSYPNYHKNERKLFGQSFQTIRDRIKATVEFIDNGKNYNKVFVGHDWGAYFTYLVDEKYPNYFDKLVTLDVANKFQSTIFALVYSIIYQWWNIFGFFFSIFYERFADWWVQVFVRKMFKKGYPYSVEHIKGSQGYLYLHLWINKFTFRTLGQKFKPSVNLTYLYGKDKPFQFHTEEWFDMIQKGGHEMHAVKGGHWIQFKHSKQLAEIIQRKIGEIKK